MKANRDGGGITSLSSPSVSACLHRADCRRSSALQTVLLKSSCSLKRERKRSGLCEACKTSGARGLIHMEGNLQLHSCLEIRVLQHKGFVFIVVVTNREYTLKINGDAQIK